MNKLKLWLEQTMTISFAIYVGIIIEGLVYAMKGDALTSFNLSWLQLVSVILTGAVCSLPTIFWLVSDTDIPKNKYIVRIIFHCIGLYAVVSLFGWIFKWYTQIDGFIMITIIYFLVYVFVWCVSLWFHKRDENQINKALDDIRDEE